MNTTHSTIKKFIEKDLLQIDTSEFNEESNLIKHGLDSLKMMRLIAYLEETFQVTINDQDINPSNMSSVNAIIAMMKAYL